MTATLGLEAEPYTGLSAEQLVADSAHWEIQRRRSDVLDHQQTLEDMGLVRTELKEVPVPGSHRLFVLDESGQPGGAYKYYGAAYAVATAEASHVVTGTAGNFGACMAEAANRAGKQATAYVPKGASPFKVGLMEERGADVEAHGSNVVDSIAAAQRLVEAQPDTAAFLHPFDNPDSVAALTLMADRVLDGLQAAEATGSLNLRRDNVAVVMQRGGGSGLAALASRFAQERDYGTIGSNVQLHEARPERLPTNSLNPRFDGLAVDRPGDFVQPILEDKRYVQSTLQVGEAAVAEAARLLYARYGQTYEPSALVGLGAILEQMQQTKQPTVFVAILSGKNMTTDIQNYFMNLRPDAADAQPVPPQGEQDSRQSHAAMLSGATALFRTCTLEPVRPTGYVPLADR